jgi:hypothetical protein
MKAKLLMLALAVGGTSTLACGSGGSSLSASNDGGDAAPNDAGVGTEAAMSADTSMSSDVAAAMGTESSTDASLDAGVVDDAGYLGNTPAPVTTALFRFANWSPDSPAFDMCIAPHGTKAFQGPLLWALTMTGSDAGTNGLAFPLVSAYAAVPPGQYDVRMVVGGTASCAVGIRADTTTLPALAAGGAETVAVVGEVAPNPGDFKLEVLGFLDDVVASGSAKIRAINAASAGAMSLIDVGTGTLADNSFLAIFRGVQIAHASAPSEAWIPYLVDPNGYDPGAPILAAQLSAHISGTISGPDGGADLVVGAGLFSAPNGAVMTVVVAGGTSSASPALVVCADNAGTTGPLSDCTVFADAGM